MNIKDLPANSYQVVKQGTGAPLNIKDLAPGSYSIDSSDSTTKIADTSKPSLLSRAGNALISSEKGFGQTIGDAGASLYHVGSQNPKYQNEIDKARNSQTQLDDINIRLGKAIIAAKKQGKDTTVLEKQYKDNSGMVFNISDILPSSKKTAGQIYGEGAGVALDVASAGSYGKLAQGAESFKLLPKVVNVVGQQVAAQTAKKVAPTVLEKAGSFGKGFVKGAIKNAPIGFGYGVSEAMKSGEGIKDSLKSGVEGALFNAGVGGLFEGKAVLKGDTAAFKAQQIKEKAQQQYKMALGATKEKYKELSDKVIPTLLAEGKWGTRAQLLENGFKNIKLSEQQYRELGELQGVAEIDGIFNLIEKEQNKLKTPSGAIISTEKGKYGALEGLKKDIQAYKVADEVSKSGGPVAVQQQLRELAATYGDTLYESRKSQQTISDNAKLSQVKKVDGAIRDLLATKNPTYADINKVYSLNNNLVDILNETAKRESSGLGVKRLIEIMTSVIGTGGTIVAGTQNGAGGVVAGLLGTAATTGLVEMTNSTWWNTLRAVQKNKIAEKLLKLDPEKRNQALIVLGRQGAKYAKESGLLD